MSGLTGFDVSLNGNSTDLSYIFQHYTSGSNPTTHYIATNGLDLSNIFQPLGTTYPKASLTGFNYTNTSGVQQDLNTLFAGKVPFAISGLANTSSYSSGTYTITMTSGSGSITFYTSVSAHIMLIGGGGNGGNASTYYGGTGGGAGGTSIYNKYPITINTPYSITVGGVSKSTTGFGMTASYGSSGDSGGSGGGASGGNPSGGGVNHSGGSGGGAPYANYGSYSTGGGGGGSYNGTNGGNSGYYGANDVSSYGTGGSNGGGNGGASNNYGQPGNNATYYGGGGGGGGNTNGSGGSGKGGVCIITFTYP
jgi:hypothetical protein